ncbi:MAG TPA: PAS domain S-box protein [Candidatus Acidoferrum sp.]|nr:PAS domain S-box protein [Candidatus Acidoferrum sp.]
MPAISLSGFRRVAIATAVILIAVLLYAIKEVASPASSLKLSNLVQTAVALLAAYCSFRVALPSRGHLRRLWNLLGTALLLVAAAQGLETYYQSFLRARTLTPWPSDLLFILWVTPAVMMFLPPAEESGRPDWQQFLDYLQVVVVALTTYLYFFYIPSRWEVEGPRMVVKIMQVQLVRDGALAVAFLIQATAAQGRPLRSFFRRMAVLFLLANASGIIYLLNTQGFGGRASWMDLAWCSPFLFAIYFSTTWNSSEELPPQRTVSFLRWTVFSQALPVLIPLLVLFMGRRIAAEQITIAWIAVAASFLLSAARLVLTTHKQRLIAEDLLRTQTALERSQRMFSTAFRSSPDAVGITSIPAGEFLEVNDGFTRLTGYSHMETLGRNPVEMNLWADPDHRARIMSELQERGEVREEEFLCRAKSGEVRTCQFSGTLITLDKSPCALVIVRDITARKQAEEALRASEERFRNLVQALHVGVVLLGPHAETRFANRAALEIFGLTEDGALGKESSEFEMVAIRENGTEIPMALRPGPLAISTKKAVRNEIVGWRRSNSNEVFWTLVDAVPHLKESGEVASVILSISDITAWRRAEEALRISEERFRTLVQNMDVAVVQFGRNAEIQFANHVALEIFEMTLEEVKGKTSGELNFITFLEDGTEIPFDMRSTPRAVRTGQVIKNEVLGWRRPGSGKVFWTLGNVVPLRAPDGVITGTIATFTDITERRRVEEALHQLSTRLLELQDEERRRLGRELHDSLAQTVLAVNLHLAQATQFSGSLSDRSRRALEEARRLLQEMSQEIRTLSYLLHPPLLDELGLVSAIKEYAEGFGDRSGIQLTLDLPLGFGRLSQEAETAFFRVVQESLSNIQRHSESPTATISLCVDTNWVKLEIRDQGKGMSQRPIDLQGAGGARLGVGILGMRERMSQLGGKLEIESGPSGTTVRATVPQKAQVFDASSNSSRG